MKPIITEVTDDWIKQNKPCQEAVENWWDKKEREPMKILKLLIEDKKYTWANWFCVRLMEYKDYVSYAVFAAEQVIDLYEKKYPTDKRPREAIEAARECIKDPSKENKAHVAHAAADAADAAHAAYAAAYAAYAAYAAHAADAADAAAYAADAAYAAHAADAAAYAADAADAAMQLKILDFGMKLLKK